MIIECPNCGLASHDGHEILRCPKCFYTKEFMNYSEFGRLTNVSKITVARWVKIGRIKCTKISHREPKIHSSQFNVIAGL